MAMKAICGNIHQMPPPYRLWGAARLGVGGRGDIPEQESLRVHFMGPESLRPNRGSWWLCGVFFSHWPSWGASWQ